MATSSRVLYIVRPQQADIIIASGHRVWSRRRFAVLCQQRVRVVVIIQHVIEALKLDSFTGAPLCRNPPEVLVEAPVKGVVDSAVIVCENILESMVWVEYRLLCEILVLVRSWYCPSGEYVR
jgi:hypothetical protein